MPSGRAWRPSAAANDDRPHEGPVVDITPRYATLHTPATAQLGPLHSSGCDAAGSTPTDARARRETRGPPGARHARPCPPQLGHTARPLHELSRARDSSCCAELETIQSSRLRRAQSPLGGTLRRREGRRAPDGVQGVSQCFYPNPRAGRTHQSPARVSSARVEPVATCLAPGRRSTAGPRAMLRRRTCDRDSEARMASTRSRMEHPNLDERRIERADTGGSPVAAAFPSRLTSMLATSPSRKRAYSGPSIATSHLPSRRETSLTAGPASDSIG
jgi:hypothetical protein